MRFQADPSNRAREHQGALLLLHAVRVVFDSLAAANEGIAFNGERAYVQRILQRREHTLSENRDLVHALHAGEGASIRHLPPVLM